MGRLPGIGAKTEAVLTGSHGLRLIGDITAASEPSLRAAFGNGWRSMLAAARGEDDSPVDTSEEDARSYSQQETFAVDIADPAEVERIAKRMVDELLAKVRADGKRVRTLTVKVRYPDFSQAAHGRSLAEATDLETPFYPLVAPLLREAWRLRRPLRLVSVRFSGVESAASQLEMFGADDEKRRRLAATMDRLNREGLGGGVQHGHQLAKPARRS